jgi:hypothetical protein
MIDKISAFLEKLYNAGYITKLEKDDLLFQFYNDTNKVTRKITSIEGREVACNCVMPTRQCFIVVDSSFRIDDNLKIFVP